MKELLEEIIEKCGAICERLQEVLEISNKNLSEIKKLIGSIIIQKTIQNFKVIYKKKHKHKHFKLYRPKLNCSKEDNNKTTKINWYYVFSAINLLVIILIHLDPITRNILLLMGGNKIV